MKMFTLDIDFPECIIEASQDCGSVAKTKQNNKKTLIIGMKSKSVVFGLILKTKNYT